MLISDGSNNIYGVGEPSIVAPYRLGSASDYAVEAEIQATRIEAGWWPSFGLVVRSAGKGGYQAGILANEDAACIWAGDIFKPIVAKRGYRYGTAWHTYRVEVKGNAIALLINGGIVAEITDNRYLEAGRVGLWSSGGQLSVRSFRVIAL